jgi:hypothetical protein
MFELSEESWSAERDAVLREWVREHPGTRPSHWWRYDSPEPRRRVGGSGMTASEAIPGSPDTEFRGLPGRWFTASCAYFRARTNMPQPLPHAIPYDEKNPPLFESEGVYLERLELLQPGERVMDRDPEVCPVEPYLEFARRLRDLRAGG